MPKSELMVCAEGVIRDAETNNISIFNLLENINAESFPLIIQRMSVFNLLTKTKSSESDVLDIQFQILNNGKQVADHPIKIDFQGKDKTRNIINLGGLVFQEPGTVTFQVKGGDKVLDKYVIYLKLRDKVEVRK